VCDASLAEADNHALSNCQRIAAEFLESLEYGKAGMFSVTNLHSLRHLLNEGDPVLLAAFADINLDCDSEELYDTLARLARRWRSRLDDPLRRQLI